MSHFAFEPWEPEESVGKLWHAFASRLDENPTHESARVSLSSGRLAVFYRALGGAGAVEIRASAPEVSHHRLSLKRALGTWRETAPVARFDGAVLRLPESLALFATPELNTSLYQWLVICAAVAEVAPLPACPLQADLARIALAQALTAKALALAPGFAPQYQALVQAVVQARRLPALPRAEAAVEARCRLALGQSVTHLPALPSQAPRGYRPMRPLPLWLDCTPEHRSAQSLVESRETEGTPEQSAESQGTKRARRRQADQADRRDSFILHKFEAILSMTEFLNLNRRVEDDDDDSARKALDDQEELGLGQVQQAPATRLKLHLDLAPEDVDREALSARLTYPEWDASRGCYLPAHVQVLASRAEALAELPPPDPKAKARIRAVRRQFEALRPEPVSLPGFADGETLDLERAIRAAVELRARGECDDRVWRQTRPERRDLAVSILLDVSRSTESALKGAGQGGRSVLDVEREALCALAYGLETSGDSCAIHAFSSLKRNRVFIQEVKQFEEEMSPLTEARIAALKPQHYTRLGAAIRHVSAELTRQTQRKRLLLVLTDGKPNDLDHYEGRHGIEDSRMAVREARRAGHAVFGITIDSEAKSYIPRIFGQSGFAVIPHPEKLTQTLPQIYRQLVQG